MKRKKEQFNEDEDYQEIMNNIQQMNTEQKKVDNVFLPIFTAVLLVLFALIGVIAYKVSKNQGNVANQSNNIDLNSAIPNGGKMNVIRNKPIDLATDNSIMRSRK